MRRSLLSFVGRHWWLIGIGGSTARSPGESGNLISYPSAVRADLTGFDNAKYFSTVFKKYSRTGYRYSDRAVVYDAGRGRHE